MANECSERSTEVMFATLSFVAKEEEQVSLRAHGAAPSGW